MPTLFELQQQQRELITKSKRLNTEHDELRARQDAGDTSDGVAERLVNIKTGLEKTIIEMGRLTEQQRETVKAGLASGEYGTESGDGANPDLTVQRTKATFGPTPTPWLPGISEYRKLQTKAIGTSGAFVPTMYSSTFFDLLRKSTAVLAAGPVLLPVSGAGSVRVPRVTTSVTISPYAENVEILPVDPGLGDVLLDPKKFAALTLVAREAVEDSNPQLREVVAQTLIRDLAVELDKQLVIGTGAGGQLTGLTNTAGATVGASTGANGAALTFAHLADTIAALENANADSDRAAWIMHSRTWGSVRKLVDAQSRPIVSVDPTVGVQRSIFGRPVFISNSLPINQTVGTSTDCSTIILADMSQVIVAVARDLEVQMSDQYRFQFDQVAVRATCRYDIGSPNPAAIVLTTGVRP